MIGIAGICTAKNLLGCDTSIDPSIKAELSNLAAPKKSKDGCEILAALEAWHNVMPKGALEPTSPEGIMRRLTEIIWHCNFMLYYRVKEERDKAGANPKEAGTP